MESNIENSNGSPVLVARNVQKSFPGVQALDGVRLEVHGGRLNALLGENGAGKSTLMNILAGVFLPDAGEILFEGQPVKFCNPREAQEAGISIIFQELNLAPNLSVAENIFLGREPTNALGLIDYEKMYRDASALLERLGLDADPRQRVEQLTIASQQVVEIAKAVSFESRVLILDEPTSALTEQETTALFRLIDSLKAQGVGLVYITHRLEELPQIADDITVLRDGKFVATKPFSETNQEEMVRLMVGRNPQLTGNRQAVAPSVPLLTVERATLASNYAGKRPLVDEVHLSVARNEIVGLFGLMGAGRTELLQTLFGMHPRRGDCSMAIEGQPVAIRSPAEAIKAGLALAPEDRKTEGLVLGMSVSENISLTSLTQTCRCGLISTQQEERLASDYVERLAVRTPSLHQQVRNLSGGNQQKVVLAKWLATNPKILMLDEPTRGIDIGAKQEIYDLIRKLAAEGLGVLMVSSELPELLALSDRILVLCEGRLTGEFSSDEANEDSLLAAALPKTHSKKSA